MSIHKICLLNRFVRIVLLTDNLEYKHMNLWKNMRLNNLKKVTLKAFNDYCNTKKGLKDSPKPTMGII